MSDALLEMIVKNPQGMFSSVLRSRTGQLAETYLNNGVEIAKIKKLNLWREKIGEVELAIRTKDREVALLRQQVESLRSKLEQQNEFIIDFKARERAKEELNDKKNKSRIAKSVLKHGIDFLRKK